MREYLIKSGKASDLGENDSLPSGHKCGTFYSTPLSLQATSCPFTFVKGNLAHRDRSIYPPLYLHIVKIKIENKARDACIEPHIIITFDSSVCCNSLPYQI